MLRLTNYLSRCRSDKRGFTLVELLVVVAILGILAAIAVPRVTQNIQSARVGADLSNERMILNALEAFHLQVTANGPRLRYPVNLATPCANGIAFIDGFFGNGNGTIDPGEGLPVPPAGLDPALFPPYANRYVSSGTVPAGPGALPAGAFGFTWTSPNGVSTVRP